MRQVQRKFKLMNGIRCARMNGIRVERRAKSKIRNIAWAVVGSVIVTDFSVELRKPTPDVLSTQKI